MKNIKSFARKFIKTHLILRFSSHYCFLQNFLYSFLPLVLGRLSFSLPFLCLISTESGKVWAISFNDLRPVIWPKLLNFQNRKTCSISNRHTYRLYRLDLFPLATAFFLCFWDIAYGIIAGIIAHLLLLLYKLSQPSESTFPDRDSSGIFKISPQQGLYFPAAEVWIFLLNKNNQLFQYLSNRIEAAVSQSCKIVTLDLGQISEIDSGTADVIKNSLNFVKKSGADAAILNANVSFSYFQKS